MKKLIYTLIIIIISLNHVIAQPHGKREKLKAYKTAYLTEQLDLTPDEAEKFWPVYNAYEKNIFQLKVLKINEMRDIIKEQGGIESLSEKEANQLLSKLLDNDQALIDAKKDLYKNLAKIISTKKILMLNRSEHQFNRKLLSDYRKRSHMNNNR